MIYSKGPYYEAILQLRPYNKKVLDYVKSEIEKNNVLISKEEIKKYGVDLKLTSKSFVLDISRRLKRKFLGTIKLSRKLYGRNKKTGKTVFRLTVCFRLKKE